MIWMKRKHISLIVNETLEKVECEHKGDIFVSGYLSIKKKWIPGYCRPKNMPFYHITDRENLPNIAQNGIIPHQDNSISAVEMQKGKVVNLFLRKEDIGFMQTYFHAVMMRNAMEGKHISNDSVILKVDVPIKQIEIMHKYKADFVWAIVRHSVPPLRVEVYRFLYDNDDYNINTVKQEFNDAMEA